MTAAAPLRLHGDRLVPAGHADLAVNVLAGGPPGWLRAALREALDRDATRYPDDREATAALAARHRRDPADVLVLNGAAEGFWLLATALRPRRAVCVHPAFTEPEAALRAAGRHVERAILRPQDDFAIRPGDVPEAADLVVLGNPTNPTGTLHDAAALARPDRTLVVDEAFMDLVPGEPSSLATMAPRLPGRVVVVRSVTKLLAIPGLRAGYLLADRELVATLRAHRQPWAVNALALAALRAHAIHPETAADLAARTRGDRADLVQRLAQIRGIETWPSAANFVLARVAEPSAMLERLRAHRLAVRPAASFPGLGDRFLRITVRDPALHARLAAALR